MNPSTLALGGVCGLLIGALVLQNRSASSEQSALVNELTKVSNDWKQAVVKFDEQGRLAYTLQTQLKLVQEEHLLVTNELPKVKGAFAALESNHLAWVENARAVSNRLRLEVLELTDERGDHHERMTQLKGRLLSTEAQLSGLSNEVQQALAKLNATSNALKLTDTAKTQLEEQLRDPLVLSAQLARHGEANKERGRREADAGTQKLRVELLPDGSVKQIP
ncbi:MAG: hypothetical protein JNN07_12780 [Verrucomicrobiales bacterium]|nr:hypothetical protein [Verrucomicrobiales bacterium]